jgi:uncharacterized protein YciW
MTAGADDESASVSLDNDFIDQLGGPGLDATALRSNRPEVKKTIQASYDVLLGNQASGGLSRIERLAVALRLSRLNDDDTLSAKYRSILRAENAAAALIEAVAQVGSSTGSERLDLIMHHADQTSLSPGASTPADLAALTDKGFTTTEIVVITQIIGLVHLQCRVLRGLQLLGGTL